MLVSEWDYAFNSLHSVTLGMQTYREDRSKGVEGKGTSMLGAVDVGMSLRSLCSCCWDLLLMLDLGLKREVRRQL